MNIETGDYAPEWDEEAMKRLLDEAEKPEDIIRLEAQEEQVRRLSEHIKRASERD